MKLKFRSALVGILFAFIIVTVAVVGGVSFYNAHVTAQDLSSQLLDQTSSRVDQQIQSLLREAEDRAAIDEKLIEDRHIDLRDFPAVVGFWEDDLAVDRELTSVFVGVEATGECTGVSRLKGRLSIWQSNRSAATGGYEQRDFWPEQYPNVPYHFDPKDPAPDIRTRPWYRAAREAGHPVWTETYPFLGVAGVAPTQGLTHAAPIRGSDGALLGVLDVDFELGGLSRFLSTVSVGRSGFAFVLERRDDGSRKLIAHADADALEHGDPRVVALLAADGANAARRGPAAAGGVVRFAAGGVRYIGTLRALDDPDAPAWTIGVVVPERDIMERVDVTNRVTIAVVIGALLLALLFGAFVARQVARPLEEVSRQMASVADFRLEAAPVAHSIVLEVDRTAISAEEMKTGLRSFQKYVPSDLVRTLLATHEEAKLGGERRRLTVYFSDIIGFTTLSEGMSPETLVAQLREYLGALEQRISSGGGTVDKFIGDAVMAFWGAPAENASHAVDACRAALGVQRELARLSVLWETQGRPPMHTGIALNTGEVLVGNIGSDARLSYTVMGDAVNLASRLEGLNRVYGTRIIVGETTYLEAKDHVVVRPLDWVAVKGRSGVEPIYELLGMRGDTSADVDALVAAHARAIEAYRARRWDEAIRGFEEVLALRAGDAPAALLLRRCRAYRDAPPGADWDGAHHMTTK